MPNYVKYSTTTPSGSLLKNNVAIGIDTSSILGPTSNTGWYSGITPSANKYIIYQTAASGDPDVYTPQSDTELITLARGKGATGANTASVSASLAWFNKQTGFLPANFNYEGIVTNGLVFNSDAGYVGSYPAVGTTWYDISGGGISGTLTNGPVFNSANSGSIKFDGVDDYVTFGNQNLSIDLTSKSFCAWVNLSASLANPSVVMDKQFDNTPPANNYGGWGFWIGSNRKLWWWSMPNQDILDTGATTIGTNVWTHIAITYNISTKTASFYINGALNSSISNSNIVDQSSGTQPLAIGVARLGQVNQSGYLNGAIGNVLVYNRVLTLAEIQQNYNSQRSRFGV